MCAIRSKGDIGANHAVPPLAPATMLQCRPNINKPPIIAYLCAIGKHKLATLDILNHIQQLKQL